MSAACWWNLNRRPSLRDVAGGFAVPSFSASRFMSLPPLPRVVPARAFRPHAPHASARCAERTCGGQS